MIVLLSLIPNLLERILAPYMSIANQMIENMEESNFDTEKFAKINDLLFLKMINEQCTDTEGWKKIVSYSPEN